MLLIFLTFLFIIYASVPASYTQENHSYKVGDTGPAGDIIFFDNGGDAEGWRYLEAAPPEFEYETNWNSEMSMSKLLNINGITGWRLPDKDELSFIYLNLKKKGLGGFSDDTY